MTNGSLLQKTELQNLSKPLQAEHSSIGSASANPVDELDLHYYRSTNPGLQFLGDMELQRHYLTIGQREGRPSSSLAFRENFSQLAAKCGNVLEIGPFTSPSLAGPNIQYFDVLDYEGLCERARQHDLPLTHIPKIQYVSPTGDLSVIPRTFNAVFSSHVIEHQPCLVTHLRQVAGLLSDGDFYFLVIPDKRYCFDHFIPESTLADVVSAYYEQRARHTLCSIMEHRALTTHNDALRHWQGDHVDPNFNQRVVQRMQTEMGKACNAQGAYVDVHAWQFTPGGFKTIVAQLYELGLQGLYPVTVYGTPYGRQEFTAILTKVFYKWKGRNLL